MSDSEKINATHDAVLTLVAEFKGFKDLCQLKHKTLDTQVSELDTTLNGNGKPGLVDDHLELEKRFDKIETKLIVWASVALFVGQLVAPKVAKMMGWN